MASATGVLSYLTSAPISIPHSGSIPSSQVIQPPTATIDEKLRSLPRVSIRGHLKKMPKGAYLSAHPVAMQGADRLLYWASRMKLFWNPERGDMSQEETPVAANALMHDQRALCGAYRKKMTIGDGLSSHEQLMQVMARRESITRHVDSADLIAYVQQRAATEQAMVCEVVVPIDRIPSSIDPSKGFTELLVSINRRESRFEQKIQAALGLLSNKTIVGISIEGSEEFPNTRKLRTSNNAVQDEWEREGRVIIEAGGLTRRDADIDHLEQVLFETISLHNATTLCTPLATRVRHPLSFFWDDHQDEIAEIMKRGPVYAEFCLTYEEQVLQCPRENHPIKGMLERGIPVVLSCGYGAGLSSTLTDEFLKAFCEYGCTVKELGQMALNSLQCCASKAVHHHVDDDFFFMGDEGAASAAAASPKDVDPRIPAFKKQIQAWEDNLRVALGC